MIRALLTTARAFSAQPESMRDFAELTDADVHWLERASVPGEPVPLGIAELRSKAREKLDDPHEPSMREIEKTGPLPKADRKFDSVHDRTLKELIAGGRR